MPFDGPKRVLYQTLSLLEDRIVTADAELDLLFRQIVSIQRVIEWTYGEIRWDGLWREEAVAIHPDRNNLGIWTKTDGFEVFARRTFIWAFTTCLAAAIDRIGSAHFYFL